MKKNELLIENIDRLHTTPMGLERIKRNLKLDTDDAVRYCKDLISNPECHISRRGKNWYCEIGNTRITVNAYSSTILLHIAFNQSLHSHSDIPTLFLS